MSSTLRRVVLNLAVQATKVDPPFRAALTEKEHSQAAQLGEVAALSAKMPFSPPTRGLLQPLFHYLP